MTAPSVRRVDQLSGHKAADVFFVSLREADDNLAELDALRESAVRVDELIAENADLRRQLAEAREQQEWGAVVTIALWGLAGLAAYFVFVVAVGKWLALEFPEPADLDVEHPRLRVVRDDETAL